MPRGRVNPKAECERKKAYTVKSKAEDAMYSYIRRNGAVPGAVHVYSCFGHFHWGHKRQFRTKR